ncbi:unnamed protein product [Lactuca saligna]|uniref:Uncharacterized protein n=1 Tax=Lactuca saligna TaxID=75948 RepID=A0AA35Y1X7_LACSI|nr:unnamed protein product [Lactuca saligna]
MVSEPITSNPKTSFESNTTKANAVITSLGSTLRTEKDALEQVLTSIQSTNTEFQSSLSSKIEKLHEDFAMENKIMDDLAVKTEKVKVLYVKLNHANKRIEDLLSEKVVMKSCITGVNSLLLNIIETIDSLITITVRKHLAEKHRSVFIMLNRLEGVSKSVAPPKQGGEQSKSFGA